MTVETKATEPATNVSVAAPAAEVAKPAEAPKAEATKPTVDYEAESKQAKKQIEKLSKEADAARKAAEESNAKLAALADALGVGKKADPVEAAQSQLAAATQRAAALEQRIAKAAAIEAIRRDFADVEDPNDVLALIAQAGTVPVINPETLELADAEGFKTGVAALLEKKAYLRKQPTNANAAPGGVLPTKPAPPVEKKPDPPTGFSFRRIVPGRSNARA